jgi:cyanate permease
MGLVGSFAPVITGFLYDRYSSYSVSIIAGGGTTLIALILVVVLRPGPQPSLLGPPVAVNAGPLPS